MPITPDNISFLQPGQPWPPEDSSERLERYEKNKSLFKGDHAKVYKDWPRLLREDVKATLELAVNFPGAVSKLFADLLFGEFPNFIAGEAGTPEQVWLDDLVKANKLHQLNYRAALAQSYRGEAIYKLRLAEGRERAVIDVIPASIWFPIYDEDNVTEILGHVLAWTKSVPQKKNRPEYLRAEIHFPGSVHQRLYRLANGKIVERVDLKVLYDNPPPDDQETGVEAPLVIQVPNLELDDSPFGVDDYMECDTLFQELDIRLAQISRVLDKHTDPNMYGPEGVLEQDPATGEWHVRAGGKYFAVPDGSQPPGYLVWDAQLEANFKHIEKIMEALYIATDTNAAAFSLLADGSVPSGAALKRLLMRPLARTNRKRLYFDPALKKLIALAAQLEKANGKEAPDEVNVEIEWKDGLPNDPTEQAQIEQIRLAAGNTSLESSVRRLDGLTGQALKDELARIREDRMPETVAGPETRLTLGEQPEVE